MVVTKNDNVSRFFRRCFPARSSFARARRSTVQRTQVLLSNIEKEASLRKMASKIFMLAGFGKYNIGALKRIYREEYRKFHNKRLNSPQEVVPPDILLAFALAQKAFGLDLGLSIARSIAANSRVHDEAYAISRLKA